MGHMMPIAMVLKENIMYGIMQNLKILWVLNLIYLQKNII